MEFSAKLTVLVLFVLSHFNFSQPTTIRRTINGDEPISPMESIYQYFQRSQERSQSNEPINCPDCVRRKELEALVSKEELDRKRIEIIKSQILRKLHLETPPNITRPLDELPDPIASDDFSYRDEREPEDSTESEVYVFPDSVESECYTDVDRPVGCFRFRFDTKIRHHSMHSAELWVYKLPDISDDIRGNQTLIVRETVNPNESAKKSGVIASRTVTVREGWVKFELKGPVYRWLRTRTRRMKGIEVICPTCDNLPEDSPVGYRGQYKPFFKIQMERKTRMRHKRSETCDPASRCCVESLYVDFQAIGWHWIRSPRGYYANYCRGSCRELVGAHDYHVSRVLGQFAAHTASDEVRTNLAACCAPTSATPLDLIYYDRDGSNNMIKRTLHNMIINSCGCL